MPLTPWLSRLINRAAGLAETGRPLTFGDLWGTKDPKEERKINLQMMTTNLTYGRPYRLPFEEKVFLFDPAEWKEFFPTEIVKWLEEHPHDPATADKYPHLRQLPEAFDFPIVVAARLSLSFPGLLSAVPLYAVDYGRTNSEDQVPEKCWFSDGGICSNFPVHFFDSALPHWRRLRSTCVHTIRTIVMTQCGCPTKMGLSRSGGPGSTRAAVFSVSAVSPAPLSAQ